MISLSNRETQILELVAKEHSTEAIARKLCISVRTVCAHRKNIANKIGTSSVAAMTKCAIKMQLLDGYYFSSKA